MGQDEWVERQEEWLKIREGGAKFGGRVGKGDGGEYDYSVCSSDADFTMLDCPPTAPDDGADDDCGFEDAPAMDANVCKPC